MTEFKLMVPTFNGKWLDEPNCSLNEFDGPAVPVLVRRADGVRIVLGTHDYDDESKPDVQIERRHNGWMLFLHPLGGSDPSGLVVFLDDGRSFVAKEHGYETEQIEMLEYEEAVVELDDILPSGLSCSPTMVAQVLPVDKYADSQQADDPVVHPLAIAGLLVSRKVMEAFKLAKEALTVESNDREHNALWALVEALEAYRLEESQT